MPRRSRYVVSGQPFHITNRGVERRRLFFEDADYKEFLGLLSRGRQKFAIRLFGLCLMPNHFHLVIQQEYEAAISAYLHWVQGIYSRELRERTQTVGYGHVFQQRFWSGVIQDSFHLLNVMRYVEANPVEGKLVAHAQDWPWGSLALRESCDPLTLDVLPIRLPPDWTEWVNAEPDDPICD
jgi:putative transposase